MCPRGRFFSTPPLRPLKSCKKSSGTDWPLPKMPPSRTSFHSPKTRRIAIKPQSIIARSASHLVSTPSIKIVAAHWQSSPRYSCRKCRLWSAKAVPAASWSHPPARVQWKIAHRVLSARNVTTCYAHLWGGMHNKSRGMSKLEQHFASSSLDLGVKFFMSHSRAFHSVLRLLNWIVCYLEPFLRR